jgi:hypothetical protein
MYSDLYSYFLIIISQLDQNVTITKHKKFNRKSQHKMRTSKLFLQIHASENIRIAQTKIVCMEAFILFASSNALSGAQLRLAIVEGDVYI